VNPLSVFVCEACGAAVFPARALCPRCDGSRWREEPVEGGVVEEATEHRGIGIASVRTDLGPVVIARSRPSPGTRVRLGLDAGAPVAEP
jgi:uncharacterized protein